MIQLLHGNCLELLKEVPDHSVDMILADLPYGTTACKWDSIIPLEPLWEQYKRIVTKKAAVVLTASQPFTTMLIQSNLQHYKHAWVWNKGVGVNFMHVKRQPLRTVEDILVFGFGSPQYFPIMVPKSRPVRKSNNNVGESSGYNVDACDSRYVGRVYTESYPSSILNISSRSQGSRGLHPTQKPVELMEYLIKTYTLEGQTVLDNTMGSGTTGVACVRTKRNFIGMELDPKFYAIACDRIQKEQVNESH